MASGKSAASRTDTISTTLDDVITGGHSTAVVGDYVTVRASDAVSVIRSRMDVSEPLEMFPGWPPPAPPFGTQLSTLSSAPMPIFTYTPTPTVSQSVPIPSGFSSTPTPSFGLVSTLPHTIGAFFSSTVPQTVPGMGFSESTTMTTRLPQYQQDLSINRVPNRPLLRRPHMVNPLSCLGPPDIRHTGSHNFQDPHSRSGVKMKPPCFDGTKVNNWIRGIQFYFDHIGTPENQCLHYVIALLDPVVADWIWNYCSSHEHITWFDFLDDVRRRFNPQCYTSHIGLIKKLHQTAGLKQPVQDEVLLHQPLTPAAAFTLAVQIAGCHRDLAQPAPSASRRPWQQRDSRPGAIFTTPSGPSQASPATQVRQGPPPPRPEGSKTSIIWLSAAEKAE
ncbi:uncharacterized protein LOC125220473 [Salvia hispanica]|uniref:uncharacterized protein LOC125220473 n=1 Tax=Salvia hispanica TaxID=49212 RepID=UPI002009BB33|nr:uncharacterized protein LOC125220473 [Salvia hispanica]